MSKSHNRGGQVPSGYTVSRDESGLTSREREVLELLRRGRSRTDIQQDLGLTKQRISALCKSIEQRGVQLPR
jgi:DNA-binding CsgD family transcriptional regulator